MNGEETLFEGKCDFCGKKGEKATKDNLDGITFLNPDLKWICRNCLKWHLPVVGVSQ